MSKSKQIALEPIKAWKLYPTDIKKRKEKKRKGKERKGKKRKGKERKEKKRKGKRRKGKERKGKERKGKKKKEFASICLHSFAALCAIHGFNSIK